MKIEFNTDNLTDDSFKLLIETATVQRGEVLDLGDLDLEAEIHVDLGEFKDQEIIDEYEKRFGPDENAVRRAYEHMAAGRTDAAMELLSDTFNLPFPDHERRIAALIARGRAKEARPC